MRIALFKHLEWGFIIVNEEYLEHNPDYIRVSEYTDVEFEPLDEIARIEQEIAQLKTEAENISDRCDKDLSAIDERIAELSKLATKGGE